MFMPSYLSTVRDINRFPTFTQSRKLNRGHLMPAQIIFVIRVLTFWVNYHGWY